MVRLLPAGRARGVDSPLARCKRRAHVWPRVEAVALRLHASSGMNPIRMALPATPGLALLAAACTSASPQPESPVERGQALFVEQGCYGWRSEEDTAEL